MTDITGNIVWKADYEPFGKVNIVVENIENNIRFPGQYYISETGLNYNWWRWYKSETGRYNGVDPAIMLNLSKIDIFKFSEIFEQSPFVYANNNAIYFTDPTGLVCIAHCFCPSYDSQGQPLAGEGYITYINCKKCECRCSCPYIVYNKVCEPVYPDVNYYICRTEIAIKYEEGDCWVTCCD